MGLVGHKWGNLQLLIAASMSIDLVRQLARDVAGGARGGQPAGSRGGTVKPWWQRGTPTQSGGTVTITLAAVEVCGFSIRSHRHF